VRQFLLLDRPPTVEPAELLEDADRPPAAHPRPERPRVCPCCGTGHLLQVRRLAPRWAQAP
jgi:hypothetical protein